MLHLQELNELRQDCAIKQKKGLHFIIASVVIWLGVWVVHLTSLPIMQQNLLTFCLTAPLMPLAWMFSKWLRIDFQNKANPLTQLGLLFSLNQLVYILIAMWVFAAVPDKMLMVFAMIFGAHLMPFSWLYRSRAYLVLSVAIPLLALGLGLTCSNAVLAGAMVLVEIAFSLALVRENRP